MYTNVITQIRNAQQVKKQRIKVPYSIMDHSVADILKQEGFLESVEKKGRADKKYLELGLLYKDKVGAIQGVKFVSKPSKRVYRKYTELNLVRQGFGVSVISTSKGIMTNKGARQKKIGGQVLFEIW